jgi:hypothetical protein
MKEFDAIHSDRDSVLSKISIDESGIHSNEKKRNELRGKLEKIRKEREETDKKVNEIKSKDKKDRKKLNITDFLKKESKVSQQKATLCEK